MTRARSRPPPAESASNVRHDEHTAHRKVELIAKNVVYGSQPGLKDDIWRPDGKRRLALCVGL